MQPRRSRERSVDGSHDPAWWARAFDRGYLDEHDRSLTPERSEADVESILATLALRPSARVLDVACGAGRHAIAFARRGFEVSAADASQYLLDVASARVREAGLEIELVHVDMRELPFADSFDLVVNLHTSFGYFEAETEDQRALAALVRAARPGGYVVVETINRDYQLRVLPARTWSVTPPGALVLERHRFDPLRGRLETRRTLIGADGPPEEQCTSVRLYASEELARMFESEHLSDIRLYAGFADEPESETRGALGPYTFESPRICVVGRKPGRRSNGP